MAMNKTIDVDRDNDTNTDVLEMMERKVMEVITMMDKKVMEVITTMDKKVMEVITRDKSNILATYKDMSPAPWP